MIVILGANGTLGKQFVRVLENERCVGLSRNDFDFLDWPRLATELREINPDVIVNCAAIVSLASVARHQDHSFKVNALLPQKLAGYCAANGARTKLIHISTDHFFDSSDLFARHSEDHSITILNEYAAQKYVAERLVLATLPSALVVRTSLLGIRNLDGKTLIEWIIKTLKYQDKIVGYADAVTSAIPVQSLVDLCLIGLQRDLRGIYNIGSQEPYSKLRLIEEIVDILNLDNVSVTSEPQPRQEVQRARSCGLDSAKFATATGVSLPAFPDFLNKLALSELYEKIQ